MHNTVNQDTNGAEESVIVSEVSSFQRLKEWYMYLGWEKVSCLELSSRVSLYRERGSTVCQNVVDDVMITSFL